MFSCQLPFPMTMQTETCPSLLHTQCIPPAFHPNSTYTEHALARRTQHTQGTAPTRSCETTKQGTAPTWNVCLTSCCRSTTYAASMEGTLRQCVASKRRTTWYASLQRTCQHVRIWVRVWAISISIISQQETHQTCGKRDGMLRVPSIDGAWIWAWPKRIGQSNEVHQATETRLFMEPARDHLKFVAGGACDASGEAAALPPCLPLDRRVWQANRARRKHDAQIQPQV